MITLFNDNWLFSELALQDSAMVKDGKPVLLDPVSYKEQAEKQIYKKVKLPHDWMIYHTKDLYKNSVGFYKKSFNLDTIEQRHLTLRFEAVYMNCAIYINNTLAGTWKYGYSTFEIDISNLIKQGNNEVLVIAVYQNPNTRWYSGAGIIRDVNLINTETTFLTCDGTYIHTQQKQNSDNWSVDFSVEVSGNIEGHTVINTIKDSTGNIVAKSAKALTPKDIDIEEENFLKQNIPSIKGYSLTRATEVLEVKEPTLWDIDNPYLYTATTVLLDKDNNIIDSFEQYVGFKTAIFDKDKGFFLNGKHLKINGACHHHDQGVLGAAFDVQALKRQFIKLKEMGVNSVRCSHNPPPRQWMNLADEMGILIDDEAFDQWQRTKTTYDYGNYFDQWHTKDAVSWIRKDRNHPCLIMWSIGNEIYDTHLGTGFDITKELYDIVIKNDPLRNAQITIASNYMMKDGAQNCATQIDLVGYNYLESLYNEHHTKYPEWKIYGSETSSTVQSRGIYHFPEDLKLVTFSDGQCSCLGNCTTTWGCANTQTVIANDRDCSFSAGQYIWTGWDYIGEPTPYHSKNSFFGQIDTAGFEKDTFYLYKSEWLYKNTKPFVHVLPYWDFNEGQIIDVKAYTNAEAVELFLNNKSLGKQEIDHISGLNPFGHWKVPYTKGEIKAVGYDSNGNAIAEEIKSSFEDPANIVLTPELSDTGHLYFIDIMTVDKNNTPVENARNYITVSVNGQAELVGLDNGDSTDYEEYVSNDGITHTRRLFANRLVAVIRAFDEEGNSDFTVTACSKDLDNVTIQHKNNTWSNIEADTSIKPQKDYVSVRKIELKANGSTLLNKENNQINVEATVYPLNASCKDIKWNPVLKECVSSDSIEVQADKSKAVIKAMCDGDCILRCTAQNNTDYDEVISDINFSVKELGNPKLNPYKLIEACRFTAWDKGVKKPVVSLQSGISNRNIGKTWISFDKIDFGKQGADTIHVPIFSFDTELPVEVWDGNLDKGECILKDTYKHQSIYNTYSENSFVLNRRLFGVHTLTFVIATELVFQGFYFDKSTKAFAKLNALDATNINGDTFTKAKTEVKGIGNNVNLDFNDMDFGEKGASKLTLCGKSNSDNNTINVKFFNKDGSSTTQVIEFSHTEDYEEKTFEIEKVCYTSSVSFIFLPGCNFDFRWFKFE